MKKFLAALLFLVSAVSFAEIVTLPIPGAPGLSITAGTGVNALPLRDVRNITGATNVTMGDDEVRNIPLGFNFPFWGRTFNESWMSSNGFVAFQPSLSNGCCSGADLRNTTSPNYNYTIFGVHSDLYAHPGVGSNWYLRETNTMTYGWYNVSQCCDANGGNSFEIKINSAGVVDTRIAGAMVNWNAVTSGMSGDLSKGEYFQAYHGQGINIPMGSGGLSWNTSGGFTGSDPCLTNPLSSPSCSGYAAAYLSQQCTINVLYDQSCPGYAAANFTLQCSLNPFYNEQCPGYADAYLQQQCSQNPLYSNRCSGYQQAYFNQQCTNNQLYDVQCPGYAAAYLEQQCSLNPLYSTTCSGYQTAYFNQQCTANPLYDKTCPGYAQSYALKYVVVTTPTQVAMTTQKTNVEPTPDSSGALSVAVVSDPVVNQVVTSTATSASPAQSATATVPLVVAPAVTTTTTAAPPPPAPVQAEAPKEQPKTARQEMQAKRENAARTAAVERGKNLANEMGKVADMESQKQVQNVVIQAMGFTPGFDAYGKVMVPDSVGYKPFTVYNNQKNVDNRRLGWGLYGPSDRLHNDLVNSQYKE